MDHKIDFFTAEEILSKKFKKGWFGRYLQTQKIVTFGYTFDSVFDMSIIGKDVGKLLSSMLLYCEDDTIILKKGRTDMEYILSQYFDIKIPNITYKQKIACLIYILYVWRIKDDLKKIIMVLLPNFLGATKIISNDSNKYDNYIYDRVPLIFGDDDFPISNKDICDLVSDYLNDLKPVLPYIQDAISKGNIKLEKENQIILEKRKVIELLRDFCGFSQYEIDFVISKAKYQAIKLSGLQDKGEGLLLCVPHNLSLNLETALFKTGQHPLSKRPECIVCWLLQQPGSKKGKCKIHKNLSIGNKLTDIAKSFNESEFVIPPNNDKNVTYDLSYNPNSEQIANNNLTCVICMTREINCTLIPCGHCYCLKCIVSCDTCPNCRSSFTNIQKIFM